MEFLIPALALGGLYTVSKQQQSKTSTGGGAGAGRENYENRRRQREHELLPNVDIPNRNFPEEYPIQDAEADLTSKLSTTQIFDTPSVYTDKYFNPALNSQTMMTTQDSQTAAALAAGGDTAPVFRSMTGQVVDYDYFRHNNMSPYFGSKVHTNNLPNATESTLDNYTGSGSQYISKTEQSPLFAPSDHQQWAYGMPSTTDFVQSRINPSSNMANFKPFEEIKVAPGLGLGYTAEGMGGYNSGMLAREQWMDKTVDQLRVNNKQKASGLGMYGHEGPANSYIKTAAQVEHMGVMEKNRVERTFEMGADRLFTTTGISQGPTMRAIPVERFVSRPETSISYTGVAGGGTTMQQVRGEYMPSHNQELGAVPFTAAYAAGAGAATESDYGAKSVVAYPNNRSLPRTGGGAAGAAGANTENGYYGAIKSTLGAAVAPFMDILRPSRKENMVGNLRPYQNAKAPVEAMYVYNPKDRAPVTHRETMEVDKQHWNINANQRGGAYETTEHQATSNQRDTTTDVYYAGVASAGGGAREARPYDAEYRQRNNDIKASTVASRGANTGGMALLNGDIQMRAKPQEAMLKNDRAVQGTMMPYGLPPSMETMGRLQGSGGSDLYSGMQLDRNNGEVLSQLKGNPYTLSVVKGL